MIIKAVYNRAMFTVGKKSPLQLDSNRAASPADQRVIHLASGALHTVRIFCICSNTNRFICEHYQVEMVLLNVRKMKTQISGFLFGLFDPRLSSLYQHSKSHVTTIILGR